MITAAEAGRLTRSPTRYYSQCGEDGVLERILALIGETNRVAVEFGGGDGYTLSNTRRLGDIGWRVVMFDGAYQSDLVQRRFITADNINHLFEQAGVPREPDVLSCDLDGNDYWVLKALDYRPRIIVAEINGALAPGERKTIPYDPDFRHDGTNYYGVSYDLMTDMLSTKGYTPICQLRSLNAFYVRAELVSGVPPVVTYKQAHYHPPDTAGRPWVSG